MIKRAGSKLSNIPEDTLKSFCNPQSKRRQSADPSICSQVPEGIGSSDVPSTCANVENSESMLITAGIRLAVSNWPQSVGL